MMNETKERHRIIIACGGVACAGFYKSSLPGAKEETYI
jgi:hypothetical protein